MPVLRNPREELYCQYRAKGMIQVAAYEAAGWKPDDGNACRMDAHPHIRERIAELQARAADRAVKTASDIVLQLDHDRALAHDTESPGAAVSASMGQAKVLGLITERKRIVVKSIDEMSEDELVEFLGEDEVDDDGDDD